jgi:hypothetical protein
MSAPGRKEFFYSRIYTTFIGGLALLIGSLFIWGSVGHFLGLTTIRFEGAQTGTPYVLAGIFIVGAACVAFGIRFLRRSCDRRPAVVVDREGLLYRACGDMVIPWREIRAVELIKDEDNNSIVLTHGPRQCTMAIDARYLASLSDNGGKDPIYNAILEAWRTHGGSTSSA